jgi:hypothetical protein
VQELGDGPPQDPCAHQALLQDWVFGHAGGGLERELYEVKE